MEGHTLSLYQACASVKAIDIWF